MVVDRLKAVVAQQHHVGPVGHFCGIERLPDAHDLPIRVADGLAILRRPRPVPVAHLVDCRMIGMDQRGPLPGLVCHVPHHLQPGRHQPVHVQKQAEEPANPRAGPVVDGARHAAADRTLDAHRHPVRQPLIQSGGQEIPVHVAVGIHRVVSAEAQRVPVEPLVAKDSMVAGVQPRLDAGELGIRDGGVAAHRGLHAHALVDQTLDGRELARGQHGVQRGHVQPVHADQHGGGCRPLNVRLQACPRRVVMAAAGRTDRHRDAKRHTQP